VWLNPPYSDPEPWALKLHQHYCLGDVSAALMLTNNATDTGWWHLLAKHYPVCFFGSRLRFWRPDRGSPGARQGQTLFYLGADVARFRATFGAFGLVLSERCYV
jgi:hypothetical protein